MYSSHVSPTDKPAQLSVYKQKICGCSIHSHTLTAVELLLESGYLDELCLTKGIQTSKRVAI